MKETGILFRAPMVLAILNGRKTQTRRLMKPQYGGDQLVTPQWFSPTVEDKHGQLSDGKPIFGTYDLDGEFGVKFPYGAPGDRLWVRETWTPDHADFYPHFPICYRADFGPEYERENGKVFSSEQNAWFPFKWRPTIFMPRRVCRITLEITSVRVERLNAISEADAKAEGAGTLPNPCGYADTTHFACCKEYPHSCKEKFEHLWRNINGSDSWEANPWVWCIEFIRLMDRAGI